MPLEQQEFGTGWTNGLHVKEEVDGTITFTTTDEQTVLSREETKELIKFLINLTNEETDSN